MRRILLSALLTLLFSPAIFADVGADTKITIRNHTDTPLNYFLLGTDNMEYFSDLIKSENTSDNPLVDKHASSSFILHAADYPATFAIAIVEETDSLNGTTPVCIVSSARLAANDNAFGHDVVNQAFGDKFKCKIYYGHTVSIWKVRKSPFSIFSKH